MRHYDVRVCEHLRISEFTGKTLVFQHNEDRNHRNDKDSFSLITCYALSTISKYKVQLQESLINVKDNPSTNSALRSVLLLLF